MALLMRIYDLRDEDLAKVLDCSRQAVQHRRVGRTRIRLRDARRLARYFGVPADLLSSTEQEIYRWLAEHPGHGPNPCAMAELRGRDSNSQPSGIEPHPEADRRRHPARRREDRTPTPIRLSKAA